LKDEHKARLEGKCSYEKGIWQRSNHPWWAFVAQSRPSCHLYGCYKSCLACQQELSINLGLV